MKVNEVMSRNVISVSPTQTAVEAAKLMSEHNIGSLPVAESGKIKGVLTDRDIVLRCVATNTDASKTKAGDIMTSSPVYINSDNDVSEAMRMMSCEQIRRLPVVENGKLVGYVSIADIARRHAGMELADALADISMPT